MSAKPIGAPIDSLALQNILSRHLGMYRTKVKDHECRGLIDNWRLTAMDAIGNIPFGGMVRASYLKRTEWEQLVREAGYRIAAWNEAAQYRKGVYALLFPNRLEVTMRLEPA